MPGRLLELGARRLARRVRRGGGDIAFASLLNQIAIPSITPASRATITFTRGELPQVISTTP